MASKRKLRRDACESKRAYDTKAEATKARGALLHNKRIRGGRHIDVYRCQFGNHWHVGHRSGWLYGKRQAT